AAALAGFRGAGPGACARTGCRRRPRGRRRSRARPRPRGRSASRPPTSAWPPGAAARRRNRTRRTSGEDLPRRLVTVEELARALVHGMLALGNVDVLLGAAERSREVALARVVGHRDDRREGGMPPRQLERRRHVAPG